MHAALWGLGTVADLGTLGGSESGAVAINGRGWIAGTAQLRNSHRHAVLWVHE